MDSFSATDNGNEIANVVITNSTIQNASPLQPAGSHFIFFTITSGAKTISNAGTVMEDWPVRSIRVVLSNA